MESSEEDLVEKLFPTVDKVTRRKRYKTRKQAERRKKIRQQKLPESHDSEDNDSDIDFLNPKLNLVAAAVNEGSSDSEDIDHVHSEQFNSIMADKKSDAENTDHTSPTGETQDLTRILTTEPVTDLQDTNNHNTSDEEAISMVEYIENASQEQEYYSDSVSEDDWIDTPALPDAPGTLWNDMRSAALKTHMTTTQVDTVLNIMHKHFNLTDKLPKCEKTLCKASISSIDRDKEIKKVSGHDYYYFGLEKQMKVHLALYPASELEVTDVLMITWNNDGLPLFKSKGESAWPILVTIANLKPKKVYPVTVTVGEGKPTDLHYLDEFVDELHHLMSTGLHFNGKHFKVLMNASVCDAPARAQIKNIMLFSSTYGCDQCESIGCHDGKRMTWPCNINLRTRTDARFRNKSQPEHHRHGCEETPLLKLDIDMINAFPPDFMHQGSGCMKKLLLWYISGPKVAGNRKVVCRMSAKNISTLNKRLIQMRQFIPDTFTRKPRSTIELPRYKAVELRQLQLYTGKIVFMGLMATNDHYYNLCTYNAALALMVDQRTARPFQGLAAHLMKQFAEGCMELYGNAFMVMNTHSHLHFADVAYRFGSLDNASAYCFENHLGQMKKMVRSSHSAIISLVKGTQKRQAAEEGTVLTPPELVVKLTRPNNVYIDMKDGCNCYEVIETVGDEGKFRCILYSRKEAFFSKPSDSKTFGCLRVKTNIYTYVLRTKENLFQYRRGMRVDLAKLEELDLPENKDVAIFMAMLHDQQDSLY